MVYWLFGKRFVIFFDILFCKIVDLDCLFADKEYRELYEKTENARLEWEAAMLKCCQVKSIIEKKG